MNKFNRTINLIGLEKFNKFSNKTVIVFGIGGVGSPVVESLVRSGLQNIIIVDKDVVDETNINRQIYTNTTNIGTPKVEAFKTQLLKVNPNLNITTYNLLVSEQTIKQISFDNVDFICDCIDDVPAKILLIKKSKELNIPIICAMGCGNKLDPTKFQIKDISKTTVCPLAKKVRLTLRNEGIKDVPVLFSTEEAIKTSDTSIKSIIYVTATAGLLIGNYIFNELSK